MFAVLPFHLLRARPSILATFVLALFPLGPRLRAQEAPGTAPPALTPAARVVSLGNPGTDVEAAHARRRETRAALLRYELATTVGAYDAVGQRDPRWDADARAALEHFAHALAGEKDGAARITAAREPCARALAAGCKDPFVAYAALRFGLPPADPGVDPVALARRYAEAAAALEASRYPALRKLYAHTRAAEQASKAAGPKTAVGAPPPSPPGTDIEASLDRATACFLDLLREGATANRDSVLGATGELLRFSRHDVAGHDRVFAPVARAFEKGELGPAAETATVKAAEGLFWVQYAWQGRTSKWAREVSDEGWRKFEERLPKAQAALERSFALDPTEPRTAIQMMKVELGQGEGREREERWFRAAMDADPDSYAACDQMLLYLEPKWYGSEKEMFAFARRCVATNNWPARLPFILLLAHTNLANYEKVPPDYWKRPEVWTDVQGLYRAALAANPTSVYDQSGYALYAYRAEQWKLADELFTRLGDKADVRAMNCTPAQLQEMRRTATARAAAGGG